MRRFLPGMLFGLTLLPTSARAEAFQAGDSGVTAMGRAAEVGADARTGTQIARVINGLLAEPIGGARQTLASFDFLATPCSAVVMATQARGADRDRDGVPDSQDSCAASQAAVVVDSKGCSLAQRVPCSGPVGSKRAAWPDHAAYVATLAKVAQRFVDQGRMAETGRAAAVGAAIVSRCGTTR